MSTASQSGMHVRPVSFLIALGVAACGGGSGELDPDPVTNLPPGDATGSAATGTYAMQSLTTGCSGRCTTEVDGFTYSACDIGTRLDETADVTQTDGRLVID